MCRFNSVFLHGFGKGKDQSIPGCDGRYAEAIAIHVQVNIQKVVDGHGKKKGLVHTVLDFSHSRNKPLSSTIVPAASLVCRNARFTSLVMSSSMRCAYLTMNATCVESPTDAVATLCNHIFLPIVRDNVAEWPGDCPSCQKAPISPEALKSIVL